MQREVTDVGDVGLLRSVHHAEAKASAGQGLTLGPAQRVTGWISCELGQRSKAGISDTGML